MDGRTVVRLGSLATAVLLLAACLPTLPEVDDPCAAWPEPGLYALPVPGYDRTPTVYVPGSKGPRGAVVMLHGAGSTGDYVRSTVTDFQRRADAAGHVALFPNGSGTPAGYYWNAGTCCGIGDIVAADDVGFLDAAAAELRERVCVDRVVAAGFSNGAMMALRWSCEGDAVDAVLAASGPLLVDGCAGDPTPVVYVHGTDDPIVPLAGGESGAGLGVSFPDARDAFDAVLDRNGVTGEPEVVTEGIATCEVWTTPVDTRFCTLEGWRHRWPGGDTPPAGFAAEDVVLEELLAGP